MSWVVDGRDFVALSRKWLTERIPGYKPDPTNVITAMTETGALIGQEIMDVMGADVLPGIEAALLERDGFERRGATSATATIAVTTDTVGPHSLPAGFTFVAAGLDWRLTEDLDVAPGDTDGQAAAAAAEPGTAPNVITTTDAVTASTVSWIDTAELTLDEAGIDAETVDEYLARGRKLKRITKPSVVLPQDFADYCEIFADGVVRACVLDGYNPDDDTSGNERFVCLSFIDADGAWVGTTIAGAALTLIAAIRESSFQVRYKQPTYTPIDCAFSFTVTPGSIPSDVKTRAEQAVTDALSPQAHGTPRTPDEPAWRRVDFIDLREVEAVLQLVEGLDRITALTLNGGTANIALPGTFPLPTADSIVGTYVP